MRIVLAFLLFVLPQAFESERHSLDLEPLLQDPAALQKLTVVYRPPTRKVKKLERQRPNRAAADAFTGDDRIGRLRNS